MLYLACHPRCGKGRAAAFRNKGASSIGRSRGRGKRHLFPGPGRARSPQPLLRQGDRPCQSLPLLILTGQWRPGLPPLAPPRVPLGVDVMTHGADVMTHGPGARRACTVRSQMAAAGGNEAAAAGKRGPLGIPEAAFVVCGAGEQGWATPRWCSWGVGPGIPETAFMGSGAGHHRAAFTGSGAEEWGPCSASRARPHEAAPPGRRWRRPFTASVLGLFPGALPCFDPDLVLYLTRNSAPRVKQCRFIALPDSGSEQRVVRALLAHAVRSTPCRSRIFLSYTAEKFHSSEAPMRS